LFYRLNAQGASRLTKFDQLLTATDLKAFHCSSGGGW